MNKEDFNQYMTIISQGESVNFP